MNEIREQWLDSTDPRHAAAAWHAQCQAHELDEEQRRRFAQWLCKSPANVTEYLQLVGMREALRDPAVFEGISLAQLQSSIGANVARLPEPRERGWPQRLGRRAKARRRWLSAAAVAATVLVAVFLWLQPARYSTAVGEQRSVILPDGSIAELNTRSTVEVRFTRSQREIVLGSGGEALFHVAKDAARPFRVRSGAVLVQAIGTEFTLRERDGQTTVAVIEGRVRVMDGATAAELGAGQKLELAPDRLADPQRVQSVDPQIAIAWKTRRLVFDDLPLAAVIAEFNRYNERQIDPAGVPTRLRHITGVFNANDPDSFVQFLKQSQGQEGDSPDQGSQNR